MRPVYQVFINGNDITPNLEGRVVKLTLEDTAGFNNDRLDIEVECVPAVIVPKRGAIAELYLGYEAKPNMPTDKPKQNMGLFVFDESVVQKSKSAGRTMSLHFHALATGGMWKEVVSRTYTNQTLAQIIEKVAAAHDMTAVVDPDFYGTVFPYVEQRQESDQSFLTRIGLRFGANFKISGKLLMFAKPGTIQALADMITEADCASWRWLNQSTSNYGNVVTSSYNPDKGKYEYSTAIVRTNGGEAERKEDARLTLPQPYPTKAEADAAAKGRAAALETQGHTFQFQLYQGNPKLKAEMMIKTEKFYEATEGVMMPNYWHLTKVTHTFTKAGGFVTSGECDRPAIAANLLSPNATPAEVKAAFEAADNTRKSLQKMKELEDKRDNKADEALKKAQQQF